MDLIKTLAARGYTDARPVTRPEPVEGTSQIGALAQDFTATLQAADQTAEAALTGKAEPQALVEALAQSQLAVETAVTVRDKVVEAYQEILRMPV